MAKKFDKVKRKMPLRTRKQIRKEKRQHKKIKHNEHHSSKKKTSYVNSSRSIVEKTKSSKVTNEHDGSTSSNEFDTVDKQVRENERDALKFEKLQKQMRVERIRRLREANMAENKEIRALEKKLKINRRKSKSLPKSFITEGLDCILFYSAYCRSSPSSSRDYFK